MEAVMGVARLLGTELFQVKVDGKWHYTTESEMQRYASVIEDARPVVSYLARRSAVSSTAGLRRALDGCEGSPCQVARLMRPACGPCQDRLDLGEQSARLPPARTGYAARPSTNLIDCGLCGRPFSSCSCDFGV